MASLPRGQPCKPCQVCYGNSFRVHFWVYSMSPATLTSTKCLTQGIEATAEAPLKRADKLAWQSHPFTYAYISSDLFFLWCQSFRQHLFATLHPTQLLPASLHLSTPGIRFTGEGRLCFAWPLGVSMEAPWPPPIPEEKEFILQVFTGHLRTQNGPQESQTVILQIAPARRSLM